MQEAKKTFSYERLHDEKTRRGDYRTPSEHDRDRILYSSAFMRLAGVAQVAHVADGSIVHNRLTHSLKVASLAASLSKKLAREQFEYVESIGGIDPAAAEAAALAHDIGHPPFGHIAEEVLQSLLLKINKDSFEGNAQSFRVVTKLAIRRPDELGLNLTRATLNGLLKYPWFRTHKDPKKAAKYGAYRTEKNEFEWARKGSIADIKAIEAEIMDWSDDVAYSTHDLEDYYRAGLLPLDRLITSIFEVERFLEGAFKRWKALGKDLTSSQQSAHERCFKDLLEIIKNSWIDDIREPYTGSRRQRAAIHSVNAFLINRFFKGIALQQPTKANPATVIIDEEIKVEVSLFKEAIWHYVIRNPSLAIQDFAQRKIIQELFAIFMHEASEKRHVIFTERYREQFREADEHSDPEEAERDQVRVVVDMMAEMTEHSAYETYKQLTGHSEKTVLDYAKR